MYAYIRFIMPAIALCFATFTIPAEAKVLKVHLPPAVLDPVQVPMHQVLKDQYADIVWGCTTNEAALDILQSATMGLEFAAAVLDEYLLPASNGALLCRKLSTREKQFKKIIIVHRFESTIVPFRPGVGLRVWLVEIQLPSGDSIFTTIPLEPTGENEKPTKPALPSRNA